MRGCETGSCGHRLCRWNVAGLSRVVFFEGHPKPQRVWQNFIRTLTLDHPAMPLTVLGHHRPGDAAAD
jgi:hypothetical protein